MSWLYYLLEANFYLLIFYGFYRLFLQQETFNNSNRYYLLTTSLLSFLIPIFQLGLLKPIEVLELVPAETQMSYADDYLLPIDGVPVQQGIHYSDYLYPIYLLIAVCFAIKLAFDIIKILRIWLRSAKKNTGEVTVVELNDQAAFSFFNLLFIHPHLAEKKAVIAHEMVHIKQKHSFDILFFEILQIICWFNPIIYFIKKDIKLLHEYIADELSTNADMQKHEYAMFLIEHSFGISPTALTNQIFNQSILKRRINMLNKKRTASWARLKLLLVIPLVCGMLCASTVAFTKDYGYVDLLPEKSNAALNFIQTAKTQDQVKEVKIVEKRAPTSTSDMFFNYTTDKNGKTTSMSTEKLIVVNNEPLKDQQNIYAIKNAKKIVHLKAAEAIKKYGDKGKNGAIEFTGDQLVFVNKPYPRTKKLTVVKPDGKGVKEVDQVIEVRITDSVRRKITGLQRITIDSVKRINLKLKRDTNSLNRVNVQASPVKTRVNSNVQVRVDTLRKINIKLKDSVRVINLKVKPTEVREVQINKLPLKEVRINSIKEPAKENKAEKVEVRDQIKKSQGKLTDVVILPKNN